MSKKQYTLQQLADITHATCIGNPQIVISGASDLESAGPDQISFFAPNRYTSNRYEEAMRRSQAGALIVNSEVSPHQDRHYLVHDDPSRAFQQILELFAGDQILSGFEGIHPTAVIHSTAKIEPSVQIGPNVVIDQDVVIDSGCHIGAGCIIGPYVKMGKDCLLHPRVVIREACEIGNRVVIQPGAVIGSCGFGFTTDKQGKHSKLNQIGNVIIEDDVEIGANTTIDRARFKSTIIGSGTKVDNLVQIAHGVKIGKDCLIISQVGIAGSAEIGNHVVLAGKVAVNGHIKIADQVMVAACSGISKSLPEPGKYSGIPALPINQYNRMAVLLRNISEYVEELKSLKEQVKELKQANGKEA